MTPNPTPEPNIELAGETPQTPAPAATPAAAPAATPAAAPAATPAAAVPVTPPATVTVTEPEAFAWPVAAGAITLDAQRIKSIVVKTTDDKTYTLDGKDIDYISMVKRGMGGKYPMPESTAAAAPAPLPPTLPAPVTPPTVAPAAPVSEPIGLSGDARVLINKIARAELSGTPNLDITKRTDELSVMPVADLTAILSTLENPATAAPTQGVAALGAPPGHGQLDPSNMSVKEVLKMGMNLPAEDPVAPTQAAANPGGGQ